MNDTIINIGTEINISKAPHILIAGTTGSGKSVCMNKIITELLKNPTSDEFIFIDIKRVELNAYKNIRQCVAYANTIKKAESIISWVHDNMMYRYELMEKENEQEWMGFPLYVCIDEFADISVNSKLFSEKLASIARLGRAAKIHLIITTQYPTREVINSQIKYNLPTRICFRTNAVGSRVVLDHQGAEKLSGSGHGIILNSNGEEEEFQCNYISRHDILRLCAMYRDENTNNRYGWSKTLD